MATVRCCSALLLQVLLLLWIVVESIILPTTFHASSALSTIQVCVNKDCTRRWKSNTPLVDVLKDTLLLLKEEKKYDIQTVSCLSACHQGPNVCLCEKNTKKNGNSLVFLHQLDTPTAAAVALAAHDNVTHSLTPKQKTHLAAVNVLDKAHSASSVEEQLRYATSVIGALQQQDETFRTSRIYTRTLLFRADLYLQQGQLHKAQTDAATGLAAHCDDDDTVLVGRLYRILADVHWHRGQYDACVERLQTIARCDPSLATKIAAQVARVRQCGGGATL